MFNGITALATDAAGNVYIADGNNYAVRMLNVESNTVCTLAAASSVSGAAGCFGGSPIVGTMDKPVAIVADRRAIRVCCRPEFQHLQNRLGIFFPSGRRQGGGL